MLYQLSHKKWGKKKEKKKKARPHGIQWTPQVLDQAHSNVKFDHLSAVWALQHSEVTNKRDQKTNTGQRSWKGQPLPTFSVKYLCGLCFSKTLHCPSRTSNSKSTEAGPMLFLATIYAKKISPGFDSLESYNKSRKSPRALTPLDQVFHEYQMLVTCTVQTGSTSCVRQSQRSWIALPSHPAVLFLILPVRWHPTSVLPI